MENNKNIVLEYLTTRKVELEAQRKKIEGLPKPIPEDTKYLYASLREKIEFLDDEIEELQSKP